jgi:uncharacterized protein (TIGR01777 family)
MNAKRIVLAGGSGFIGRALTKEFLARNYEVLVLTRKARKRTDGVREVEWDNQHIGEWIQVLDGAEAVVNLTGKNINCRHTPENLREIIDSRVNSVKAIGGAIFHVQKPPRVWVQASAVGFYGDAKDKWCDENSPAGNNTLAEICQKWEAGFNSASLPKTRKVLLRVGFVLGENGGALPVLKKLTKLFLGGRAGNGKQFISWIHLKDLTQMFVAAVENENLSGIFNAVAPEPVRNKIFMRELRRALHRPWSPPAPKIAVRIGSRLMQSEASLVLASQRCVPKKFLDAGFQFEFADVRAALKNLCR